MKVAPQSLVRAAAGFLNSMSIYERLLACASGPSVRRGLAMKARAIVVHDRLLTGEKLRGSRV